MATDNLTPIFAPDVVTQQQQIAQQQALAQALMQQGMQDTGRTQMAGNVAIRNSPVSGIANMLSAYLGGDMLNKSREQQRDINRQNSQRMLGMFGANNASMPAATPSGTSAAPAGGAGPSPQALGNALGGNGTSPLATPAPGGGGPLSMPGSTDPMSDAAMYAADPKAYIKQRLDRMYPEQPADVRTLQWLQTQTPEMNKAYQEMKRAGQSPYRSVVQGSDGFYEFDNRAPAGTPPIRMVGAAGSPILPVPADPAKQGAVAEAKAIGTGMGEAATVAPKALAEKAATAQLTGPTALKLFDDFEAAVMRQPATPLGRSYERAAGIVGMGSEDQQTAIAEGETIASQLMAYAEKLPGPASDKDRIDFKASVGAYADPTATKAQRLAALRQAKKSFTRMVQKYGNGAPDKATTPGASRFKVEVVE